MIASMNAPPNLLLLSFHSRAGAPERQTKIVKQHLAS